MTNKHWIELICVDFWTWSADFNLQINIILWWCKPIACYKDKLGEHNRTDVAPIESSTPQFDEENLIL